MYAVRSFVAFLIMCSLSVEASSNQSPAMSAVNARLYNFEVYPDEKAGLEFSAKRVCPDDKIQIRSFESSTELPSAETGKLATVRILNIYANVMSPCSMKPRGTIKQNLPINAAKGMTHVYVTAGDGVIVEQTK